MSGIYQILNTVNGKSYIGSAVNFRTRFRHHRNALRRGTHCNPHLQHAHNKYGPDAFEFLPIERCEAVKEVLEEKEQFWIDQMDVCNPEKGYNICPVAGTCQGRKCSPEAIERMRNTGKESGFQLGHIPWNSGGGDYTEEAKKSMSDGAKRVWATEEHKVKMRVAHLGQIGWNRGKKTGPLTEEHRRKISAAVTGKVKSEETRRKLSESLTGRKLSEAHRQKMSEAGKDRVVSDETRQKQSQARMGHLVSTETRRKIGAAHRGKTISTETREKISAKLAGAKRGPLSEETKKKIGDANRGNESNSGSFQKGHKHSPETIAKFSASLKGHKPNSGSFGKGHKESEETKKKRSESLKRTWARRKLEAQNGR